MDKKILQTYSTWAKDNLENQIEVSLKALGINDDVDIKKAKKVGDFTVIEGDATSYPADLLGKRDYIISLINRMGYRNVIEEFAYTWFNRFVALRFMEAHDFLPHGFRVLSNPGGGIEPEILKNLNLVAGELKLDLNLCNEYKQQGKIEELYRYVLLRQCNALSSILPMLFSTKYAYLDLLLPKTLLKGETVLTKLIDIPESAFLEDVEIIGWMYQFYISSKKDAVYASKKTITKYTLPAVTQLFTPDWIVRYMAQNSVGRLWLESYPDSLLRLKMKYYVEDAEQTPEVQKKLEEIRYKNVNPEDIRVIEPCCGSGHILVYVFDLLYEMYEERGYQKRDIPTLILKNNLTGLDVDKRAVQLASFSLVMRARSVNNHFFDEKYYVTPHVYELQDSKMLKDMEYRKQIKDLNLLNDTEINLIDYLVDTFEEGKTIGSLLKVKPIDFECLDGALEKIHKQAVPSLFNTEFLSYGVKRLKELATLAKVLSATYDVMITNPPYIGPSSMEASVKAYSTKEYPNSKTDMFAMFMETGFVKKFGFTAMINMHSWMFLSSYAKLRKSLLSEKTIITMAHLGAHAFETIGGEVVQTTAFVIKSTYIKKYRGVYYRLVDAGSQSGKEEVFLDGVNKLISDTGIITSIPSCPLAYWVSSKIGESFEKGNLLKDLGRVTLGMRTGDNDRFLRFWHEVSYKKFNSHATSTSDAILSKAKWFPYNKGGEYRKWYGNTIYAVNWENNGEEIKENTRKVYPQLGNNLGWKITSEDKYFTAGIAWSRISTTNFGVRVCKSNLIFDTAAPMFFPDNENYLLYIAGFMCTKIAREMLLILNPTLAFQVGDVGNLPIIINSKYKAIVEEKVIDSIDMSTKEWDSFEFSWDFERHTMLARNSIENAYKEWELECQKRFNQLKSNEEELNRIFIDIYGLQDELTPEVEDKDVTVRLADKERDIRSLISYLIGIVMGRYSLDSDGLAYAGGDWDASKYITYQPDDDGIVPIYTKLGMQDGLTTKLIELIKLIYGEKTYRQNIDFIAEALGKNNNESSEETLNRYLNDGFYPDHLKIYQKRPIYWMFSSGKKAGFKCLIYMHRYNEDTLARINAKYYLPESTRKKNELDELNGQITKAEGRDKTRLEKERQNLAAAYNEAIEYGQVLDHMANQYIKIDLDDGVIVNYAKFQEVQLVTDSGTKVKKDLLVPLK
jgi:type II restriction/modification system DNA methylase subunit YeeA